MFNKLLLAVDINAMEGAHRLAQAAKLLAAGDGAEIHVINVVPGSGMNMVGAAFEGDYNRSAKSAAEKALKDWTDGAFDGKAQVHVTEGTIYDSVLRMADRIGADVIVVGRGAARSAFGKPLAAHQHTREMIAQSRMEIDQARLLTMQAAYMMDTVGNKAAKGEIAAIKVVAPHVALRVIDRAIQVYGGEGVCQDTPLPLMYAQARTLRLADGPDIVHTETVAKEELRRQGVDLRAGRQQ